MGSVRVFSRLFAYTRLDVYYKTRMHKKLEIPYTVFIFFIDFFINVSTLFDMFCFILFISYHSTKSIFHSKNSPTISQSN